MPKDQVWHGTMLQELMEKTGATQEELCAFMGCRQPQISRMWKSGYFLPKTIVKLEAFFAQYKPKVKK